MRHGGFRILIRPIVAELGFRIIEPGNFGVSDRSCRGPGHRVAARSTRSDGFRRCAGWRNKPRKLVLLADFGKSEDEQIAGLLSKGGFLAEMLRWARIWCQWPGALWEHF